jgi:hypothetical protein
MKPIKFEEAYARKLGAGDNPNTGDLPYVVATQGAIYGPDGPVFLVSCWEPSADELAAINATGKVWLAVMANRYYPTQPPVLATGFNPFSALEYKPLSEEELKEISRPRRAIKLRDSIYHDLEEAYKFIKTSDWKEEQKEHSLKTWHETAREVLKNTEGAAERIRKIVDTYA